ncbi:MAG: aldo/keto reductase [Actinobacteria bacterium]|nr:aldo/keto reductase [Actinomycetota bacterium]MDA2981486.1 aldo/keto reductase [Actinomycetota bacterium]MDA2995971.1 aldo/keto reductase [Actinomycetota bacterium]
MARHNQKIGMKRVDLELTRLSLGTAPLAGLFKSVDVSESDQLIRTALENGMNYFDTAPLYGHGLAEERLGRILSNVTKPFVLQTKVGRVLNWVEKADPVPWFPDADPHVQPVFDYSADGIKRSLDESLKRLGVDHIDIALMHDAENHISEAINIANPVLADLKRQGIIKAVGIGINFCDVAIEIMKSVDLDIVLLAGRYTLLDQSAQNKLLPYALERRVDITIGGVFNSGVLADPKPGATFEYLPASDEIIKKAQDIGAFLKNLGIPLTAAALQFPLRHPAVTSVLTGSRNSKELLANAADFDLELPEDIWNQLEDAGLIEKMSL